MLQSMKILIIEDDLDAASYLVKAFREAGHTTEHASDGESGLFMASENSYDVLIVDRMLPKRDGLSVISELRKRDVNTPVLILSALGQVDDRVTGLRAGGDDYLPKPYSFTELLARVEVLGRRRGSPDQDMVYRVGDLELDRLSHNVRRNGKEILLQPREFRLLEYLMKYAGQVVTRTMLLENVWDYHFDPQTNVIDVHVSRLRSKIEKDFDKPLLRRLMTERVGAIRNGRFRTLYRNTAVRLSALYLILFAVCAAALVFYVTSISEDQLRQRMKASVEEEVQVLNDIFSSGGIQALLSVLENLSNQPGANLYVIAAPNGELLAGNVARLQPGVIDREGWTDSPFLYSRFGERAGGEKHMAVARIFFLENGARILVGRDLGEPENARLLVRRALMLALGIMGLGALIIWFAIGRTALQRIDRMSGAAQNIMAGDLSQRLPVSGAGDEFDRLSVSLNAMLARMERLDEGLRQVSDNIAHDLKTPLTRLRNKAESALASDSSDTHAAALEDVIAESDQLIRTFNALLMISRVEAGSAVAEMTEIDLGAVAGEVAELYEPLAEDEGLAIVARELASGCMVRGNRELVGQVISNLIDNAIKYGSGGEPAEIAVIVKRAGGAIILEVVDHGSGIPEEKYEEATKRFVRLDESRSKPGTGLGLALAVAVMELHGGRIEFAATDPGRETNRGLTVRMVFPEPRSV